MIINVFSFFDDKGRARHPLVINRNNHERVANLLYWNELYAPITSIACLFSDITKHGHQNNFCPRGLGHFSSDDVLARHKELCTEMISCRCCMCFLHPNQKSQLKFINYKFCTIAPFVIYADFESILEPLGRKANLTTYTKKHKVCEAAAILCSTLGRYNQLTVMKVRKNALSEFLDVLIKWETAILEKLQTNRPIKRMSAQKREEYEKATQCYICRHAFEENNPKGPKVRDHDHITGIFIWRRSPAMQLGAIGQFPNPGLLPQLPWIRRAPDRPRVREETGARDKGDRSEDGGVSPVGVEQEHGLPRLVAVLTCPLGATLSLARQDRPWELLQSPRSCRPNLPRVGC